MTGAPTGHGTEEPVCGDAGHVLADAGRLAAAVLAEAEHQAQDILRDAHATARWMLEEARAAVDEVLRSPGDLAHSPPATGPSPSLRLARRQASRPTSSDRDAWPALRSDEERRPVAG